MSEELSVSQEGSAMELVRYLVSKPTGCHTDQINWLTEDTSSGKSSPYSKYCCSRDSTQI